MHRFFLAAFFVNAALCGAIRMSAKKKAANPVDGVAAYGVPFLAEQENRVIDKCEADPGSHNKSLTCTKNSGAEG